MDVIREHILNAFPAGGMNWIHARESVIYGFLNSYYFLLSVTTMFVVRRLNKITRPFVPRAVNHVAAVALRLPMLIGSAILFYKVFQLAYLNWIHETLSTTISPTPTITNASMSVNGTNTTHTNSSSPVATSMSSFQMYCMLFFALRCFDVATETLISLLEMGRLGIEAHHGDPPKLAEWGIILHFLTTTSSPSVMHKHPGPVLELIVIDLLGIFLTHSTGLFGKNILKNYRLVPTGIVKALEILHYSWIGIKGRAGYPVLFSFSRFPECILVLIHCGFFFMSYLTHVLVSHRLNEPQSNLFSYLYEMNISYSDDATMAMRKLALSLGRVSDSFGFDNEMEPILAPIGLGLPPSGHHLSHVSQKHMNAFRVNLDELEEIRALQRERPQIPRRGGAIGALDILRGQVEPERRNEGGTENSFWRPETIDRVSRFSEMPLYPSYCVKLWATLVKWLYMPVKYVIGSTFRLVFRGLIGTTVHIQTESNPSVDMKRVILEEDDDDDKDFVLDDPQDIMDESEDDCADDDHESTDSDLYKEVFWLAQDMVTSHEAYQQDDNQENDVQVHEKSYWVSLLPVLFAAQTESRVLTRSERCHLEQQQDSSMSMLRSSLGPFLSMMSATSANVNQDMSSLESIQKEIQQQRHPAASSLSETGDDSEDLRWRTCVVCKVEPRTIVLRPCGCLCLCDQGCREALASRDFHECPCCRRVVKGYQRVYLP